jgi:hypothetical protein
MTRKEIGELPNFFDRYILLSDENLDLLNGLEEFSPEKVFADVGIYEAIGERIYAPEKWTIKDILQHCIDTERIMSFRALCFARGEANALPGFDENEYAKNTNLEERTVKDLLEEFSMVRKSTIALYTYMDNAMMLRKGTANMTEISPLALGFVIVGHAKHHERVIREKYYSLAQ